MIGERGDKPERGDNKSERDNKQCRLHCHCNWIFLPSTKAGWGIGLGHEKGAGFTYNSDRLDLTVYIWNPWLHAKGICGKTKGHQVGIQQT